MDVLPNEEEQMLKNLAREFLDGECSPGLAREMETDEQGFPPSLWEKMANLGWLGLVLPEKYGGQGAPLTYLGIILEEAGRAIAPVPLLSTMVPALTIASDGTEAQRHEILPSVIRGDMILTWALTERDPRFLPETVRTEAVADGDHYIISGTKLFVENFNVARKCLVVCRTGPPYPQSPPPSEPVLSGVEGMERWQGISLFLVDTSSPGISYTPFITLAKDQQGQVVFERVRVPGANLVGNLNHGWPIAKRMVERATVLLCAQMVGATRKDMEMAIDYAKSRVAFGRPIAAFQSIQHLCADMVVWVDGAQLLTYEALWRMDQGLPASVEVSQAKAFCNEKCQAVVRTSQTIHGGIGFMKEFNLNLWYRRVCAWTMRLGTTFEHRSRVAQALLDQPGRVRLGESMYELAASTPP